MGISEQHQATILLVDDDPSILKILRHVLERDGYKIVEAADGAEVLHCFQGVQPNLILMDALMPNISGFEACAQLQVLPGGNQIPVLMVTSLDDQKSVDRAFAVGATDYITKPIHMPILRQRVRRILSAQESEKQVQFHAALFNQIRNAVIVVDTEKRITYWNHYAETLYQWQANEVIGKRIHEVTTPLNLSTEMDSLLAQIEPTHSWNGELVVRCKDGHSASAYGTIAQLLDPSGNFQGYIQVLVDITERKQMEEELKQYRDHLEVLVNERTQDLKTSNDSLQLEITERKRIDSELRFRAELEKLITTISTHFISLGLEEIDKGIHHALRILGKFAGADRGYVLLFSDSGLLVNYTYEWSDEGIQPWFRGVQNLPVDDLPWVAKISQFERVYVPRVADLPDEAGRAIFEREGVQSHIAVPLIFNGLLVGLVGFDAIRSEKLWREDVIALFKIVAEIFVHALKHKETEEALHKSEEQLRRITDNMLDIIYQTDIEGVIEYASPSCWNVLGYMPGALIGHSIYSWLHPEDVDNVIEAVQTAGRFECRYQHINGQYLWLETLTNFLVDPDGTVKGIIFGSRDITERVRAEQELQELNRLKTEFLSTAAHELRTPLTSIRGFSEILLFRQMEESKQKHYAALINEQSVHLGHIIDDLLDVARLEARRHLALTCEPVNVAELIGKVLTPIIESNSTHTILAEQTEEAPIINADPFRLGQVIKNLVSNALKYSPKGTTVRVQVQTIPEFLQIIVQDEGIGMTSEQQTHLFEQFYRADASNTGISGTGLGLAICKLIVELHGGQIWITSIYGSGTTAYFTLPLHAESQLASPPMAVPQ